MSEIKKAFERNDRPLQTPGADRLIREEHVPARDHNLDVRWILDRAALEQLLQIAKSGSSGRVVVHNATIRIRYWQGGDGHLYQTISIGGSNATPENPLIVSPRGDGVSNDVATLLRGV